MKKLAILVSALMLLSLSGVLVAQTATHQVNVAVNGFQIIRVNDGAAVSLTIAAPATPGDWVSDATDASQYLQYSVLRVGAATYKITGRISTGTMPTGLGLYVNAATPSGGTGTVGSGAGEKLLSGTAADLVSSISNCYTGITGTSGSNLTYRLTVSDLANVAEAASTAITVTYTITT